MLNAVDHENGSELDEGAVTLPRSIAIVGMLRFACALHGIYLS